MPRGNGSIKKVHVKRSLSLHIPFKAISTNTLYSGKKTRSYQYKKYRRQVLKFLDENFHDTVSLTGNLVLEMEVGFSSTLSDASNSIKGIEDVVAEYFKFNDRQIQKLVVEKYLVNKGEEYVKMSIKKTHKNNDRRHK